MGEHPITVQIQFRNVMAEFMGREEAVISLPSDAGFDQLLLEIGRCFSATMRPGLWDENQGRFKPGVVGVCNHKVLQPGENASLSNGDCIEFFLTMAGG